MGDTLGRRDVSKESVLREDPDRSDCVSHHLRVSSVCTATCTVGILENQLVPVRDVPRTAASPWGCGPYMALSVPRKGNSQNKPLMEGGRAPEAPHKSRPRLRTRFPLLCVDLCVGLPHRESCELSAG